MPGYKNSDIVLQLKNTPKNKQTNKQARKEL